MTETRSERGHANRLIREKSPYLIKHAYNPVDWFPWGAEALEKAKKEDKPVFLSIGYSTCHWCTVMEHESFENEAIATQLNRDFVPIKVDREERPDLDDIYMKAVMAMTRQGGWPLSVFLTPDLKPFYGGTYFPPSPRHGLPAFPDVLNLVADLWKNKREMVTENSNGLAKYIQEQYATPEGGTLSKGLLDACYAELVSSHDEQYGGFAGPPKFPLPSYLEFLLRYRIRTKRDMALRPVKKTLESLASGGIHDHLAGGFHRYSTDRFWLVPHFEKMLYDNALLAKVFLEGHQVMGGQSLLETARDTLEWMLNEMRDTNGGFYSAQDADTSDGEGYYYTWSPAETESILGREDSSIFNDLFGVTPEGDFEGARSILHRASSVDRVATKYGRSTEQVVEIIEKSKAKLLTERQKRARPAVDDKVLTSWNGLAISAFALGYTVTGEERYLRASTSGAAFILDNMVKGDLLFRRYRDGEVAIEGTLEDYSFLASALLDVYEATFDARWLEEAIRLAGRMTDLFWDSKNGGFFMNASMEVLARIKEGYDGPTPSGNSMAALLLLRLSEFTGREDLREKAELTMKAFGQSMDSSPLSHTFMLCALDFWFGSKEIVLAGPTEDPLFRDLVAEIRSRFIPNKVVALSNGKIQELSALTGGKTSQNGRPTVYICENFACKKPVSSLDALREQLVA